MTINKILVVDDSPTERYSMQEVLTRNGYQVVTAESGEMPLPRARASGPT